MASAGFVLVGSGLGYSTGIATKTYGQHVLAYGAVGLALFSYLTYKGYIDLDKVRGDIEKTMDQDGDGDFDEEDRKILADKYSRYAKKILLITAGFVPAFAAAVTIKKVRVEWEAWVR